MQKQPKKTEASKTKLELKETFYARARDLFECFTDSRRIQAFTQAPAECDPTPGGRFSLYGGSVVGTFREMEAPSRIVQEWRFNTWPQDVSSSVSTLDSLLCGGNSASFHSWCTNSRCIGRTGETGLELVVIVFHWWCR